MPRVTKNKLIIEVMKIRGFGVNKNQVIKHKWCNLTTMPLTFNCGKIQFRDETSCKGGLLEETLHHSTKFEFYFIRMKYTF